MCVFSLVAVDFSKDFQWEEPWRARDWVRSSMAITFCTEVVRSCPIWLFIQRARPMRPLAKLTILLAGFASSGALPHPTATADHTQKALRNEDNMGAQVLHHRHDQLRAVLHVGPHKTGSSTLQHFVVDSRTLLEQDKYMQLPYPLPGLPLKLRHQYSDAKVGAYVAICYLDPTARGELVSRSPGLDCNSVLRAFASFLDEAQKAGNHVLLTAESFDHPTIDFPALSTALRSFATFRKLRPPSLCSTFKGGSPTATPAFFDASYCDAASSYTSSSMTANGSTPMVSERMPLEQPLGSSTSASAPPLSCIGSAVLFALATSQGSLTIDSV